jgi:hypothetical protein
MFKVYRADKDTYITDRYVNGTRRYNANVGNAGTLDLYKLWGYTLSSSLPQLELSRLLIHFDTSNLQNLVDTKKIDVTRSSFNAKIVLFDVYGGQPTPNEFYINVNPLSKSFLEGFGRDVVSYSDNDISNFYTSSRGQEKWILSGANSGGPHNAASDYITSINGTSTTFQQYFATGEEDLEIDVTVALSATLTNQISDSGFRISYSDVEESDQYTYFVKRFASRTSYDIDKRPRLIVRYDDSLQDDTLALELNVDNKLFLYNYVQNDLQDLVSASNYVTGTNCLLLKLETPISGGSYVTYVTASQAYNGTFPITGTYVANVNLNSNISAYTAHVVLTGSVDLTPTWCSFDETLTYLSGSKVTFYPQRTQTNLLNNNNYNVVTKDLPSVLQTDCTYVARVNIFDYRSPYIKFVRRPIEMPNIVIRDVHYTVRDVDTNEYIIPLDVTYNSTRTSSDTKGHWFELDASILHKNHNYIVDVYVVSGGTITLYKDTSARFAVSNMM